jgi:hypothetical protein
MEEVDAPVFHEYPYGDVPPVTLVTVAEPFAVPQVARVLAVVITIGAG